MPDAPVPKWEYLSTTWWEDADAPPDLNPFGLLGWELVAVLMLTRHRIHYMMIYKRPLPVGP